MSLWSQALCHSVFRGPKVGRGLRTSRVFPPRLVGDDSPYPQSSLYPRSLPYPQLKAAGSGRGIKFSLLVTTAVAWCVVRTSAADTTTPPVRPPPSPVEATGPSFDTFRPIAEQNIFNPNRVGRSARTRRTEAARPPEDAISLVGTMEYEKGYFAFFDSPNAKFRGVLAQGGVVADFTVKQVSASRVELAHGDQTLSLQIAQQLTRVDGGDWTVSAVPARIEESTATPVDASSSAPANPTAIPADASDTLKRLMEQRQKQLKE